MKPFMDQDFLLHSDVARRLYHKAAETMPILDLSLSYQPEEIAEDRHFDKSSPLFGLAVIIISGVSALPVVWRNALSPAMLRIRKNSSNGQRFLAEQSAIHSITGVIWNYSVTLTITAF